MPSHKGSTCNNTISNNVYLAPSFMNDNTYVPIHMELPPESTQPDLIQSDPTRHKSTQPNHTPPLSAHLALSSTQSLRALHTDVVEGLDQAIWAGADGEGSVENLGLPSLVFGILERLHGDNERFNKAYVKRADKSIIGELHKMGDTR